MQDIKIYLSAAGEPVADTAFVDAHSTPCVVYLDRATGAGSDFCRDLVQHDLTVERYSADGIQNAALCALLEALDPAYTQEEKQWLSGEECFMEVYTLNFKERR